MAEASQHPAGSPVLAGLALLCSQLSLNLGAAIAKHLFPQIGVEGVTAYRVGISALVMLLIGFITYPDFWQALLPAALYLGLHTLEGQILTPIVLGHRMAISPLVLMLALMVFGWLWGIIGLLLAVPLLVCVKIILSKVEGWEGWAKLME